MKAIRSEFMIEEEKEEEEIAKLKMLFQLPSKIKEIPSIEFNNTEKYPTVWFNAWRFEREKAKATIPLMITLIEKLSIQIEKQDKDISKQIKDDLISFLKGCEYHLEVSIPGLNFGIIKNQNEKNVDDNIQEISMPTTQKGLDLIVKMINTLIEKDEDFRIIVFIDDLDRCSPQTTLEVFESIKILLNVKGIIYIIGLSHNTVNKLIDKEYEFAGVNGEDYIQKIIQIPVWVPTWKIENLTNFISYDILPKLKENSEYYEIIKGQENLLPLALTHNPREVKRFINSFIFSFEILKSQKTDLDFSDNEIKRHFLVIKLVNYRWKELYEVLFSDDSEKSMLIKMMKEIANCNSEGSYELLIERWNQYSKNNLISEKESTFQFPLRFVRIFTRPDLKMYQFFQKIKIDIDKINWSLYESAREISKETLSTKVILWIDVHPWNNEIEVKDYRDQRVIVDQVLNTEDALKSISIKKYDLIISDISRGKNEKAGLEFLSKINEQYPDHNTPIFIYAGLYSVTHYANEAKRLGALVVTSEPDELMKRIDRIIH